MNYFLSFFKRFIFKINSYLIYTYKPAKNFADIEVNVQNPHFKMYNSKTEIEPNVLKELYSTETFEKGEIEKLYTDGNKMFIIYDNNNIAGYGWVAFKERVFGSKTITLNKDSGFIFKCYTLPDCRQKNIYSWGLINTVHFLRRINISHIYIDANKTNYPSLKGIERAGFEFSKAITTCKLFKVFNWTFFNDKE